ncbi:hypothetical protein ABZP36_031154 [Zizania latifolia]
MGDTFDEELETGESDEILVKMQSSVESDPRQAAVWNILGLVRLRIGQLQSAILVLSSLTAVAPDYLDSLAHLGDAYIQSGNLELAAKCFQEFVLKDHHPAALVNYAALLPFKYGSLAAGGNVSAGSYLHQKEGLAVAKECLLAAVKANPTTTSVWVNLANAYYIAGEHKNSKRCLKQAARHEPSHMPFRGRTVSVEQDFGAAKVTRDGVSIAKSIEFSYRVKNVGASLVEQVTNATNDTAGNGTTCVIVLMKEDCKNEFFGFTVMRKPLVLFGVIHVPCFKNLRLTILLGKKEEYNN